MAFPFVFGVSFVLGAISIHFQRRGHAVARAAICCERFRASESQRARAVVDLVAGDNRRRTAHGSVQKQI